jgi:hypothetical protein
MFGIELGALGLQQAGQEKGEYKSPHRSHKYTMPAATPWPTVVVLNGLFAFFQTRS